MGYLLPAEYEQFGLPADTTDDWITTASALMESYCRRPSLLATQYVERVRLTANSQTAVPSYNPLAIVAPNTSALVAARIRYGQPRRGELQEPFLAQVAWAFSIPGSWSDLDPTTVDINPQTGEITFPRNFLGLGYNEVEFTYTAGLVTIPDAVKVACAQVVRNAQATPAMNVRANKIDTMQMQYFSSSIIDPQIQSLLRPYLAQRIG
ncbi:hypothetical protein HDF16_001916 [Granulicella aggregans]|uniref:PhiE125 gp8 family phage protein n=1 Tax=Granulicella aggregans TaxID=474949 RepID=A0A7W7ZC90_9BACT|nr:hypothetical protein [Granulicella aggregans]MBB5057231.1 hypothetical protein [Granulicella aggregans]